MYGTYATLGSMISKDNTYAIIGASRNGEKYGYKVLKDLFEAGYHVIPVHPEEEVILGLPVYPSVKDIPDYIDVAVMIVPPEVGVTVLKEIIATGIKKVWFQPGAERDDLVRLCQENGVEAMTNSCIMIEKSK